MCGLSVLRRVDVLRWIASLYISGEGTVFDLAYVPNPDPPRVAIKGIAQIGSDVQIEFSVMGIHLDRDIIKDVTILSGVVSPRVF